MEWNGMVWDGMGRHGLEIIYATTTERATLQRPSSITHAENSGSVSSHKVELTADLASRSRYLHVFPVSKLNLGLR